MKSWHRHSRSPSEVDGNRRGRRPRPRIRSCPQNARGGPHRTRRRISHSAFQTLRRNPRNPLMQNLMKRKTNKMCGSKKHDKSFPVVFARSRFIHGRSLVVRFLSTAEFLVGSKGLLSTKKFGRTACASRG